MKLGKNTNVTKTASNVVKKYCLENGFGREEVALELGIVKGTLDNKLKLSDVKTSLTVEEILQLCEITDTNEILIAMCAERGLTVYDPIETMADGGDISHEVLVGVLNIDVATGKLADIVKDALEDDEIDTKEAIDIANELKNLRRIERKLELMLQEHEKNL